MAEDDKWGRNIDKIAYGAAGVIGLLVLAIPFLFGGQIRDGECSAEVESLKDRIERQPELVREALDKGQGEPALKDLLAKQWTVGPAVSHDPAWVTDLQPVLIRKVPQKPQEVPVHAPGKITEIACERDAEKKVPFLVVRGSLGEGNQHVVIKKTVLLRKEGEGEFAAVPGFTGVSPQGSFEYKDYAVEQGKTYSYQVKTTAVKDQGAPKEVKGLDPRDAEKTSDPLGPTPPVPHDFYVSISSFESPDAEKPDAPPRLFGKLKYWDYKAAKAVDWQGGNLVHFEEKQKFANDRFEFFQVLASDSKIVVRDDKQAKFEITLKASKEPREVSSWPAVVPAAAAPPEGSEEPPAVEEEPPAKKAPAAKAKAPAAKATTDKSKEKAKDKAKEKTKPKAEDKDKKKKFK